MNQEEPPSRLERAAHAALRSAMHIERRFEPYFRPALNALLREPSARVIQSFINRRRPDLGMGIAEERIMPGEEEALDAIIARLGAYMHKHYKPGGYERGGNTKTHGIVRGELIVRNDVPSHLRHGVFAMPSTYRTWVRFSGPGPDSPADIDDVGFVSCAFKLMGVPGTKLLDDEKFTQDFLSVCTPTFVTPDVMCNAALQAHILRGTPVFYFFQPGATHLLDFLMQSWWNETQTNPLEARYWSCVPYLLGEGQAMMYAVRPKSSERSKVPRVPLRPPDNYLRDAMIGTLDRRDVEFDVLVQVQTDPHRMPIENAAVRWPEELSPFVPVATLRIPRQKFAGPQQSAFAKTLSLNPWHCIPEHRPLGNQGRARRKMYFELAMLRQKMNATPHLEPTGDEIFD
jgi:hypothetical protein